MHKVTTHPTFSPTEFITSNTNTQSQYFPPYFQDKNRLTNIQSLFGKIDEMYHAYAKEHHFPGYAFGVMLDSKLIHVGSGGYTDIQKKIPATAQSMFRIASVTKSITAMAILKLRDQGKLRLDDFVYVYLPEIKSQKLTQDSPDITIRDLLTHSAGFPKDDSWGDRNLHMTEEAFIELLKQGISFSNVPGTVYEYSNITFSMLGLIIKRVSGVPYQKYIAINILHLLGIEQSAWEFSEVPPHLLAQPYKWVNSKWEEEQLLHDGSFGAMGGMITSIESFSRYVALHQFAWPPRDDAEVGPLQRSSIREMHQSHRFNELSIDDQKGITTSGYGYGIRWSQDSEKKVYVGHSGGLPGFGSNWCIMPEYGIGVMLFANNTYAPADKINLQILQTIIKEAKLKPIHLPPSTILKERQKDLMKLLPGWENAEISKIFADNFFLDYSIESLKNETIRLFQKTEGVIHVHEIQPENQLRGYFMIEGKKTNIKISFTLTPHKPALIQEYCIEECKKDIA